MTSNRRFERTEASPVTSLKNQFVNSTKLQSDFASYITIPRKKGSLVTTALIVRLPCRFRRKFLKSRSDEDGEMFSILKELMLRNLSSHCIA